MKLIILAGGSGVRLWPVSRRHQPKHVQVFFDSATLLQKTWARLNKFFKVKDIFVATTISQVSVIKKDLPRLPVGNILIEPEARGTLPALVLAAIRLTKKYPQEVLAIANSDHYIDEVKEYARVLRQAAAAVKLHPDHIGLIGIKPTYPDTGYGYIKIGRLLDYLGATKKNKIYKVARFVEKPDMATALSFIRSGNYFWNPAYFVFYPVTLINLVNKIYPRLRTSVYSLAQLVGQRNELQKIRKFFRKLPPTSIDYGLLEKINNLLLVPAKFSFTDIGNWRAVYDILSKGDKVNVVKGKYLGIKSSGNLIYNNGKKLISTIGVNNFIIVETHDALLICPKEYAQEVRHLVELLAKGTRAKLV